ncbi:MAG TPA: C2H2-type zinc finger protein [Candidatus Krumholzibacteriaceae bacterium]|nr:C2H2-type zinc finger protein [Candidatus Krumholzibacteriaceae bacterium]
MAQEDTKFHGVVNQVGLERDEAEFRSFNLTLGIKVKTGKKLSLKEGERLIKQMRKEFLGKNIAFEAVSIPCPVCGRTFNTEAGMKQHVRRQHNNGVDTVEPKKKKQKKASPKKKGSKKKT